jgi:hypothetical protein
MASPVAVRLAAARRFFMEMPAVNRSGFWSTLRVGVLILVTASCAAAQRGGRSQVRPLPVGDVVAPWERVSSGAYENRGLAQVERLGTQWLLNVMCDGIHATYIDTSDVDLAAFSKGFVSARYRYVERTTTDVKCVKEPCLPVRDRRVAIERLTTVAASADDARRAASDCRVPGGN